jgi:ATP-binding cassette subfamily B protein
MVAISHLLVLVCGLASWWVIGDGALSGTLDYGLLAAWALLLGTAVVVRAGGMWIAGRLVIDVGILLRERLLAGVLRISPDDLRAEGVGLSLGRVFESTVFEQLAITGGFRALFAVLELAMAVVVLAVGAGGWSHVMLLLAVLVLAGMGFRRYFHNRKRWSEERLRLTHGLVESILGAQTRLAQQEPDAPHIHDDRVLAAYATRSAKMDQTLTNLQGLVPRGWLLLATSVLAVVLVVDGPTPASLAIALGGILLTHHALESLIDGSMHLVDAAIAWRALAPLMAAARHAPHAGTPSLAFAPRPSNVPTARMLGVVYHARNRTDPILTGAELTLKRGEYVRLTGASGSGKSTLAAILAALRTPQAGLVLSGGLDYATLGATGWRRRIACAPDFHDNHLFTGPLGFNLLVERWPPRPEDLAEARAICDELGLGPLIDRMPAGMFEMVGETGWQLSHGERSRIFIARALLQHAELVILDESLGALDPVTLALTIACIEKRAPSALVIAHP